MIRRGFWLVTGAVLGVAGYRRATRLARVLTGQPPGQHARTGQPPAQRAPAAAAGVVSAAGFARDVRDGMAEYWELHRDELGRPRPRTLGSQGAPSGHVSHGA